MLHLMANLSWLGETWIATDEETLVMMVLLFPNGQGLDCLELLQLASAMSEEATAEGAQPSHTVAWTARGREGMPS